VDCRWLDICGRKMIRFNTKLGFTYIHIYLRCLWGCVYVYIYNICVCIIYIERERAAWDLEKLLSSVTPLSITVWMWMDWMDVRGISIWSGPIWPPKTVHWAPFVHLGAGFMRDLPSGYLTVRHGIDDPNRNRWFTELNSMVIFQIANCECHNQRVYPMIFPWNIPLNIPIDIPINHYIP
jgi:hypothetical protein